MHIDYPILLLLIFVVFVLFRILFSNEIKSAAVMLILNDEGKILGISRREDKTKFGLPGGKSEVGESAKETAIRETREETSVQVLSCVELYKRVEPPRGFWGKPFYTTCFYALEWTGTPQPSEEGVVEWLNSEALTTNVGAFPEYNRKTLNKFKEMFPGVKVQ